MADDTPDNTSFLGTGWSFPPEFVRAETQSGVRLVSEDDDIQESLRILFGTARGERMFQPAYGLDMQEVLFQPVSTTLKSFLAERVKIAVLIYEPRIEIDDLRIDTPDPNAGTLAITLEYTVRSTNSRFNLVFPFYQDAANEMRAKVGLPAF
jgi:phage baseplate assembly protein W